MGKLKDIQVFSRLEEIAQLWRDSKDAQAQNNADELAVQYIGEKTDDDDEITKYVNHYEQTKTQLYNELQLTVEKPGKVQT